MKAPFLDSYFFYCESTHLKEIFTQVIKPDSIKFSSEASNLLDLIFINDLTSSKETIYKIKDFSLKWPSVPLVVVTTLFNDPYYLKKIFDCQVGFSLPSDLTKQEGLGFISILNKDMKAANGSQGLLPEELMSQYAQNVFSKFLFFHDAAQEISHSNYKDKLKEMSNEAHKIVGSAGSFGFVILGEIARELDQYLLALLHNETIKLDDFKDQMDHFMRKLLLAYQKIPIS